MKLVLVFVICLVISMIVVILRLLYKNYLLRKQMQYIDEANMWHKLAFTDDLTGIYNRTAYNKHIAELKMRLTESRAGIILFDIDNFKAINDTKGHLEGDRVLQTVAGALSDIFSAPGYNVYRIGGDEFAVIGENISENEIIERLIMLRDRFEKKGDIRLSKGYAIIRDDIKQAFGDADKMLYTDKASKKYQ